MDDLPAPPALDALRAERQVALFLDFDGTLVELAAEPDGIEPPDNIARRLATLAGRLDERLAVVTGRALDDLQGHTGPLQVAMAGSHGGHCLDRTGVVLGDAPDALTADTMRKLQDFADDEGFYLERKSHGAALHYRSDPSLEKRGVRFAEQIAQEDRLEIKRGKAVIELVHPGADKGTAVKCYMHEEPFAGSVPVFIGDDVTDEDGFASAAELGGFGILVGELRETAATYRLPNPSSVLQWLDL